VAAAVAVVRGGPWRRYFMMAGLVALISACGWAVWPQGMPAALLPFALLLAARCLARSAPPAWVNRAAASA
jgi:hypothetical protein